MKNSLTGFDTIHKPLKNVFIKNSICAYYRAFEQIQPELLIKILRWHRALFTL
jgi:hypothetical protein